MHQQAFHGRGDTGLMNKHVVMEIKTTAKHAFVSLREKMNNSDISVFGRNLGQWCFCCFAAEM